ncbi:hypothetical protein FRACYDRAFT_240658 [Fragilariopsis cylindrus CCMP1102]|uniref:Uncharacterized protein n=1 Tax=Fragilariopsis cylindrus CCMP1102 TaxID=635003 RepID=A0A1E7FCT4_9STRA|nr:hypothetical protein FRACYDRAFT_240658 [Fragilariopsis cylindrus CCMP1102]|eukprot:OEU15961.1 hypothetical protein FRACYDRAFT_240658 [Fragilariopsis cylindrus CCMP1102]
MNCYKPKKLCLLCSYRSIEKKQFGMIRNGIPNTKTFQQTDIGLTCKKCNSFTCIDCINLVVPVMCHDKHKFESTVFFDHLEQASSAQQSTLLDSHSEFIGHCCLINKSFRLETDPVHPNQHRCDQSRERSIDSRLSGCIFIPEFLLFIDSPIDCMDIHTVGGEYEMKESNKRDTCRLSSSSSKHQHYKHEYLPPRWGGVVPHDFAVENAMLAPDRYGEFPDDWKLIASLIQVEKDATIPHRMSFQTAIFFVGLVQEMDLGLSGLEASMHGSCITSEPPMDTKPITAVLITSLAKKFKNKKEFCVHICPQAINAELKNIKETRLIVIHRDRSQNSKLPIDLKPAAEQNIPECSKFKYFYTVYNLNFVKATFVLHAVGFHRDTFADGDPSLENKISPQPPIEGESFFEDHNDMAT